MAKQAYAMFMGLKNDNKAPEAMIDFFDHLVRTAMLDREGNEERAKKEFVGALAAAEKLEKITDLVQVSSSHANASNGLTATRVQRVFERYKKQYEK